MHTGSKREKTRDALSEEVIPDMFPNLSAGTGPAAAILVGAFFIVAGNPVGWLILLGGFALSFWWSGRRW